MEWRGTVKQIAICAAEAAETAGKQKPGKEAKKEDKMKICAGRKGGEKQR